MYSSEKKYALQMEDDGKQKQNIDDDNDPSCQKTDDFASKWYCENHSFSLVLLESDIRYQTIHRFYSAISMRPFMDVATPPPDLI